MAELEVQLQTLQTEMKSYFDRAAEEKKTFGSSLEETKTSMGKIQAQMDAIDASLQKRHTQTEHKSFSQELQENENVQKMVRDKRGRAVLEFKGLDEFERKTITTTNIAAATDDRTVGGIVDAQRLAGIVGLPRPNLIARGLFSRVQATSPVIYFLRYKTDWLKASPQVETELKFENTADFETVTTTVKTIATVMDASKQILEDWAQLENEIRTGLAWAVMREEENQILFGDGTGENLDGIVNQAAAFDTGLLTASDGWEMADLLVAAREQLGVANEVDPNFVALNTAIYWRIMKQKDSNGQYIYGNPMSPASMAYNLWGLQVVPSTLLSTNQFIVGSSLPQAAQIFDRHSLVVEMSTENNDNFKKNLVTFRAEERIAFVVKRPDSYVTGSFSQSPA